MSEVRVRFAPSPTGDLHIGGARTALFNWLFARKNKGAFILRIDDTDTERSREEYWTGISEALNWLGMDWDEGPEKGGDYGPYFQSRREGIYKKEIDKLLDAGKAYYCYCSKEDLTRGREEAREKKIAYTYPGTCRNKNYGPDSKPGQLPVVRFKSPESGETVVSDIIRGEVKFDNGFLDDTIIMKSTKAPTYNFANVIDDCEMKISHVIRAEEHLSNTPRQQQFAEALGYDLPVYAHVPMILAPDRSKLSKRHGATSVQEFMDQGFLPEALINYLALLGWSPPDEKEILPLDEIINFFSLEKVVKTAAIYDVKKIIWINGHYIREGDADRIVDMAIPFLQKKNLISSPVTAEEHEKAKKIFNITSDRVKTLEEFADTTEYLFKNEFEYDEKSFEKIFGKEESLNNIELFLDAIKLKTSFDKNTLSNTLQEICEKHDISLGKINKPLRLALSGKNNGPELIDIMISIGYEETTRRIKKVLQLKGRNSNT